MASIVNKEEELLFNLKLYREFLDVYKKDKEFQTFKALSAINSLSKVMLLNELRKDEKLLQNITKKTKLEVPDIIKGLLSLIPSDNKNKPLKIE